MSKSYLENVNFLVVEDNPFMRSIIKSVLRVLGAHSIKEATDGASALQMMNLAAPDIILVDWEMQPVDGLEFVKMVRRADDSPNPFAAIIMLSGHSEHTRVMAARDAGVNEFLVKPISAESLFKRIQQVIESPRPFVRSKTYFGPDRRRHAIPHPGKERRKGPPETVPGPEGKGDPAGG